MSITPLLQAKISAQHFANDFANLLNAKFQTTKPICFDLNCVQIESQSQLGMKFSENDDRISSVIY